MMEMLNLATEQSAWHALLDFHVEAGVDCALDDQPLDRFSLDLIDKQGGREFSGNRSEPAPPRIVPALASQQSEPPRMRMPGAAISPEDVAVTAREQARNATSLAELEQLLSIFEGCALSSSAKNLVFADGSPTAKIMFVGEAPGGEEDRVGKPFVGRSGQLLDRMLGAIGVDRSDVYIANIVPWRPPGNRTPTPQEVAICKPFIERQIELVNPDVLVCLGGPSAQNLLNLREGILRTRGRWFSYSLPSRTIRALATLHPAYLLRQPLQKRLAWRDFQALKQAADEEASGKSPTRMVPGVTSPLHENASRPRS